MRSLTPLLVTAALLTGGPTTSSSFASAQQIITTCSAEESSACAAQSRTCYNYEETGAQSCGYCLEGFFEYEDECINIDGIDPTDWLLLSKLLKLYLPDYVDPDVSDVARARRLKVVARIISFWNSRVPPPEFTLGLTEETFLTEDELRGRMGILADMDYDLRTAGKRGEMGRFEFGDDDDEDGTGESKGNGRVRGLASQTAGASRRKLQNSVDWAADGYTTAVKNQGVCGCCWAVATAGAVESALMITNQTTRYDTLGRNSLSFQQMISCDKEESGCGGGNILQATRYVWENNNFNNNDLGGLLSYEDWPYSDFLGKTSTDCMAQELQAAGKNPAAYLNFPKVVNSVRDRSDFNERKDRLMAAVAQQPVISVLRANCPLLSNYKGGVLTHDDGCQCDETSCIDHAIVIVGYDATAPIPYWKLRNSWGPGWGEEGYFRIAMNDQGIGEWGLFGCLAESAIPSEAVRNVEDLPERPGWWETAATWEKTLVILFSILGFCCLCGCLGALVKKKRGDAA